MKAHKRIASLALAFILCFTMLVPTTVAAAGTTLEVDYSAPHLTVEDAVIAALNGKGLDAITEIVITGSKELTFEDCQYLSDWKFVERRLDLSGSSFEDNTIKQYAFNTGGASEILLPDSVIEIQDFAFYGALKLTHMTIPASVKALGCRFIFDTEVASVFLQGTPATVHPEAFYRAFPQTGNPGVIVLPEGVTLPVDDSNAQCYNFTQVHFSSSADQTAAVGGQATLTATLDAPLDAPAFKWYKSGGGEITQGVHATASGSTLTLSNVQFSDAGDYYAVMTYNNETLQFPEIALSVKAVTVGGQSGTLTAGEAGTVTYPVTTVNVADGSYPATVHNLPAGVTVSGQVAINNNTGTLTLAGDTNTVAGVASNLTLTIDGTTSGSFTLTVDAAQTQPQKYGITVDNMTNGSVSVQGGLTEAAQGTTIHLTVNPDSGYILTPGSLKYNSAPITGVSFTMPGQAVTITAQFEAVSGTVPSVSANAVNMPENGDATFVVYLGDADSATVSSGDTAIATATPASIDTSPTTVTVSGKSVGRTTISLGWSGGSEDGNTTTVDVEVYADTPAPNQHTLTISAGTGGSVSPSGASTRTVDDPISITATPDPNYVFNGWTASGISVSNTPTISFNMPDNDVTLTANFQHDGGGQQPTTYTVSFYDGSSLYASKTVEEGSSLGADFPANPVKANYRFDGWWTGRNGAGTQFSSTTTVTGDLIVYAKWTYSGGYLGGNTGVSSGSGSSGNVNSSTTTAAASADKTFTAADLKAALDAMEQSGRPYALFRFSGQIKIPAGILKELGTTPLRVQTTGSPVQVQLTIPEPGRITTDLVASGAVKGSVVNSRKVFFEKWYTNKVQVVHLDHSGSYGQAVEIAAKADLTGMDVEKLVLYSYDKATNTFKRIENPAYWIDKNGYLHFTTETGGDIVVSEGALEKK